MVTSRQKDVVYKILSLLGRNPDEYEVNFNLMMMLAEAVKALPHLISILNNKGSFTEWFITSLIPYYRKIVF